MVEAIALLWETLGRDFVKNMLGPSLEREARRRWDALRWKDAAERYHDRMTRLYSQIRMLGKTEPTDLDDIFTDVFLLDQPAAYRRFAIHDLRADPDRLDDAKRINGLELVKRPKSSRLFILGKPGAGKTTFLKYLTMQALRGNSEAIPIFISLKEWADSPLDLMPFIVRQFEICQFPDAELFITHVLNEGKALVLFDGLDEVQQEGDRRAKMIHVLREFSDQYLQSQCVISCRIAASDYSFTHFTYVEVADFNDAQIDAYVTRWFGKKTEIRDRFFAEYQKEEHKGLRDLARIPLLLSLLCLAFEQTLRFPQRRVEIYDEALNALLIKWDSTRGIVRDEVYKHLSIGRKKQVLARVAVETFSKNEYFIAQKDIARMLEEAVKTLPGADRDATYLVDGTAILKSIEAQHGLLVERAYQIYSFSHLTFQEYFTAMYIAESATEPQIQRLFEHHLTDNRWREVFLMTTSMLGNADTFLKHFRTAIDDLIRNDPTIVEMLQWAMWKAEIAQRDAPLSSYRIFYVFIGISFHARALTRALDLALTLARALTLDHAHDRVLTLNLNRSFDRAFDHAHALTLDLARDRTIYFDHDIERARALARARARILALDHKVEWDLLFTYINVLAYIGGRADAQETREIVLPKKYIPLSPKSWSGSPPTIPILRSRGHCTNCHSPMQMIHRTHGVPMPKICEWS